MKCNKCGAAVPDDAKFCIECGNNLEEQRAEAVKEAPGDPAVEETAEAPETEGSEVKAPEAVDQAEDQEGKSEEIPEPDATEPADEETAPEAGEEKAPAFTCPRCGAEVLPGDKFCTKCGATLVAPEPPMGQPAQPVTQQPVQQPTVQQPAVQPTVQQPPVQQPQQVPYQQPVQQPYYGQPQYQQPVQYPPQYAQPQQPQYPPQYAQPQQPAPEKSKRGKTPFWVWIIVGVLAAALIFCIVWFFVVPNVGNSGNSGVAQSQGAANGPVYINAGSSDVEAAENDLGSQAEDTIRSQIQRSWRNPNIMKSVEKRKCRWDGNTLVVSVFVSLNPDVTQYYFYDSKVYGGYFTYVKFNNVFKQDGGYHYDGSPIYPKGKLLNLFTDDSGDHHKVAGYMTEDEAFSAAGV